MPSRQRDSVLQRPHAACKPARHGVPGSFGVHHPYAAWRRTLAALGAPALTHASVCLSFCLLALAGQPNSGTAQTWSHDACDAVAFCRSEIVVSNLSACFSSSLQSDVGFRLQRLIEMSRSGPRSINQTERAITPNGVATNALLSRRRNVITASGGGRRNCALSLRLQEVQRNRMPVRPFPVFVSTPQGDLPQSLVQHPRLRCAG